MKLYGDYFYGHKLSDYSLKEGRLSYADLVAPFDVIMNNYIFENTQEVGYWEMVNGNYETYYDEDGNEIDEDTYYEMENDGKDVERYENEIYQYFIVEPQFAELLEEESNEIVFYNDTLDMYIWGVCHWGTSWTIVPTDIKIERE